MQPDIDQGGVEDPTQPWNAGPNEYSAPANSWEERAIRQATVVMTMPRAQVQRLVRPPLPQISPRGVHHSPAPGIKEILDEFARLYPDASLDLSGSPAGYSGTIRNGWDSTDGA